MKRLKWREAGRVRQVDNDMRSNINPRLAADLEVWDCGWSRRGSGSGLTPHLGGSGLNKYGRQKEKQWQWRWRRGAEGGP